MTEQEREQYKEALKKYHKNTLHFLPQVDDQIVWALVNGTPDDINKLTMIRVAMLHDIMQHLAEEALYQAAEGARGEQNAYAPPVAIDEELAPDEKERE